MAIHSSGQIIFSLTHIEGITVGAGEEVDEVSGGASGTSSCPGFYPMDTSPEYYG